MLGMMIPWGGKGSKGAQNISKGNKMSKLPSGDSTFWEGAKN